MQEISIKWVESKEHLVSSLLKLREESELCDVTLVSDDNRHISAHKLVLSANDRLKYNCSVYEYQNAHKGEIKKHKRISYRGVIFYCDECEYMPSYKIV